MQGEGSRRGTYSHLNEKACRCQSNLTRIFLSVTSPLLALTGVCSFFSRMSVRRMSGGNGPPSSIQNARIPPHRFEVLGTSVAARSAKNPRLFNSIANSISACSFTTRGLYSRLLQFFVINFSFLRTLHSRILQRNTVHRNSTRGAEPCCGHSNDIFRSF